MMSTNPLHQADINISSRVPGDDGTTSLNTLLKNNEVSDLMRGDSNNGITEALSHLQWSVDIIDHSSSKILAWKRDNLVGLNDLLP
jgi:hypothetical protein